MELAEDKTMNLDNDYPRYCVHCDEGETDCCGATDLLFQAAPRPGGCDEAFDACAKHLAEMLLNDADGRYEWEVIHIRGGRKPASGEERAHDVSLASSHGALHPPGPRLRFVRHLRAGGSQDGGDGRALHAYAARRARADGGGSGTRDGAEEPCSGRA